MRPVFFCIIILMFVTGCASSSNTPQRMIDAIKNDWTFEYYKNQGGIKVYSAAIDFKRGKINGFAKGISMNKNSKEEAVNESLLVCKKQRNTAKIKNKCKVYFIDFAAPEKGFSFPEIKT